MRENVPLVKKFAEYLLSKLYLTCVIFRARPMVTEVAQPQSMPVQMSSESAPQKFVLYAKRKSHASFRIVTTPAEQPPHRLLGSAAPEPSRMPQPGHHGNGPAPMFVPARGTRFSQRGRGLFHYYEDDWFRIVF